MQVQSLPPNKKIVLNVVLVLQLPLDRHLLCFLGHPALAEADDWDDVPGGGPGPQREQGPASAGGPAFR